MRLRVLVLMSLFAIPIACGQNQTIPDVPCPLRPELIETELEASDEVKAMVIENYLRLIEHVEKLEVRAGCR